MSSSQPFISSSQMSGEDGSNRRSKFTYKHLGQLALSSTNCPLRVIAHLDLDAFYAQCEMVRLGLPEDTPLAVQQWQGLIAINYPARKFGMTRHITITEAKRLCPELVMQHVATWREGDDRWAYREDSAKNIARDKVSLDPYRLESRKILACIKETLPANLQTVEKASIDEVFLDLSAQIHSILIERYPELSTPPNDDPSTNLPMPPSTVLDWQADSLVDLDTDESEEDAPDWDDIAMLLGSEILRGVRATIREKLQYTCSAGIAHNKMLAKLGSGYKKPNQQTVIRNRAIQNFLLGFKVTKIRNLGGKLGEQVVANFETDEVGELLSTPLEQMKQKLGDDTGSWVYHVIRGIDTSEVNSRTQIKSMLSAKSFRPSIKTSEQAIRWLKIFVADIFLRLVDEGVLENRRRPKTINLHIRSGGQTRSRQSPIPQGKKLDEQVLFELSKSLLAQTISEGNVWPCANISLSVGGFEDGVVGNMGIGSFLVKGDEAKALNSNQKAPVINRSAQDGATKRKRKDEGSIGRFFTKTNIIGHHEEHLGAEQSSGIEIYVSNTTASHPSPEEEKYGYTGESRAIQGESSGNVSCPRCNVTLQSDDTLLSHQDWHLAQDLQDEEDRAHNQSASLAASSSNSHNSSSHNNKALKGRVPSSNSNKRKSGDSRKRPEKGQSKLTFR
ncbi:hypothetical protein F5884DRAFT_853210 [Xylogone sp. PMI_703]|nr:hypothetical protein F5884DRAFT_853210 [Xylogone sp. PMI_703]